MLNWKTIVLCESQIRTRRWSKFLKVVWGNIYPAGSNNFCNWLQQKVQCFINYLSGKFTHCFLKDREYFDKNYQKVLKFKTIENLNASSNFQLLIIVKKYFKEVTDFLSNLVHFKKYLKIIDKLKKSHEINFLT